MSFWLLLGLLLKKVLLQKPYVFFTATSKRGSKQDIMPKPPHTIAAVCSVLLGSRLSPSKVSQNINIATAAAECHEMLEWVKKVSESSQYSYGSRRLRKALNALGYPVGRKKTQRLMKEAGVFVRYRKKYKATTNSKHKKPLFENVLNRKFATHSPDQAYVSDITYVHTQEGWLYLAVVIDLFSRKVVGWSMSSRMTADLVCNALKMAIWQRKPHRGLIVHSDRGSQYASYDYRKLLKVYGCVGSMSRRGDCWDNAVAESFFSSLKQERVQWRQY